MADANNYSYLAKYKNIFGDTRETIRAIQKFINSNNKTVQNEVNLEEDPAASINRILDSQICENTAEEIRKIINKL